jgi:hypothetical protein
VGSTAVIFGVLAKQGLICERSFNPSTHIVQKIMKKAEIRRDRMRPSLLRHTALCYYFAHCEDLSRTAEWGGVSVDFYQKALRLPVQKVSAKPFWEMVPAGTGSHSN